MTFYNIPTDRGIIRTIIIIVVALLVLSYFGYNLRDIVNSPTSQSNFSYVGEVIGNVWNNYLKAPATYVWNIFVVYVWEPAFDAMVKRKAGEMDPLLQTAQQVGTTTLPAVH